MPRENQRAQYNTLRRLTSRYIKTFVARSKQGSIASLPFNDQCRQLSWLLGTEDLPEFPQSMVRFRPAARHRSEVMSFTHYIRAVIAAVREVEIPENLAESCIVPALVDIGESEEEILNARIAVWSELCRLIPTEVDASAGPSQLDRIEDLLLQIKTILEERR